MTPAHTAHTPATEADTEKARAIVTKWDSLTDTGQDYVETLVPMIAAALASARAALWQSIETAPKDGGCILVCAEDDGEYIVEPTIGWWEGPKIAGARRPPMCEGWFSESDDFSPVPVEIRGWGGCQPTHWQPLPKPPRSP